MVARTPSQVRGDDIEVGRWDVYEVEVSLNDTVTAPDYSSAVALDQALLIKKSDRSTITTTKALNVVTVTGASLNEPCLLFVAGVAA